jgi:Holliday junction resolvase RusA-like endonuclease
MIPPRPSYIVLPKPVSTNNLFRNVEKVGRVATSEYRKWQRLADEYLSAQRPLPGFIVPVEITVYSGEKSVGNMDASNTLKAIEDCLVKARVIRDDNRKHLRSTRALWVPNLANVVVEIIPARPAPDIAAILRRVPPHMHEFLR